MRAVVGLGNPGKDHARSRHNVGHRLIELLTGRFSLRLSKEKSIKASVAVWGGGGELLVACSETWMNQSGEVVKGLVERYGLVPETDLLVVVDDVALPFGRLRLRGRGSDGGHNGLKSVQECLATQHYARLRIGIGADAIASPLEDYVLSPFSAQEEEKLPEILERGHEACRLWMSQPLERAMNVVNSDDSLA